MKKLGLMLTMFALAAVFCSCDKDELGVYSPKMRISQVYNEVDAHTLREQWTWNGELLSKIDYYRKNGNVEYTDTYFYDENRLSRIERDNKHTDFIYDGKILTAMNTYSGDNLTESYTLEYTKHKLTKISIKKYGKSLEDNYLLNMFLPDGGQSLAECKALRGNKAESYNFSTAEVELQWDGDNVEYMRMTLQRPDSVQNLVFSYLYDDGINVRSPLFTLQIDHQLLNDQPQTLLFSKNNVISVYVTERYDIFSHSESFTYSYDYYKKYPMKVYSTFMGLDHTTGSYKPDSLLLYSYRY